MTISSDSRGPRRVGGNPAYVAAHGTANEMDLPFEHAYALARLVLDEGGGPVTFTGKKAKLAKPGVIALRNLGLVEQVGCSEFNQRVHIELNVDGRVQELIDARYSGLKITPLLAEERVKWLAQATQARARRRRPVDASCRRRTQMPPPLSSMRKSLPDKENE